MGLGLSFVKKKDLSNGKISAEEKVKLDQNMGK